MRVIIRSIFVIVCLVSLAYSAITRLSRIGPTFTSTAAAADNNHGGGTNDVTIAAGGAGVRNCLTQLDVVSAGAYVLRILDGGTTTYQVALAANDDINLRWSEEDAFCGTANTALGIKVTTTSAGGYSINHQGFTY